MQPHPTLLRIGTLSGDLVNLNKARKARASARVRVEAVVNRIAFGRTKAQKAAYKAMREKAAKALDQTRRDP